MGLFSRLGNLWKGFLSLWIADIEKEHPEIAYENAINSMIAKYAKLKSATAAIIACATEALSAGCETVWHRHSCLCARRQECLRHTFIRRRNPRESRQMCRRRRS